MLNPPGLSGEPEYFLHETWVVRGLQENFE